MDDAKAFLTAISKNDQLKTRIAELWNKSDAEACSDIINWMEYSVPLDIKDGFCDMPSAWVEFLQMCSIAGLRQALIDAEG